MSIDYYLVDPKRKCAFDVGQHRHEFAYAIRQCVTETEDSCRTSREEFIETCVARARENDKHVPGYSEWVAKKAPLVWAFMEESGFKIVLVDDCGDVIDACAGWPVVGSVFDSLKVGTTL